MTNRMCTELTYSSFFDLSLSCNQSVQLTWEQWHGTLTWRRLRGPPVWDAVLFAKSSGSSSGSTALWSTWEVMAESLLNLSLIDYFKHFGWFLWSWHSDISFDSLLISCPSNVAQLTNALLLSSLAVKKKENYASVHEAVKAGDVEQLSSMIKSGAGINDVDLLHRFTPLHCAAHSGSLEVKHYVSIQTQQGFYRLKFSFFGRGWTKSPALTS